MTTDLSTGKHTDPLAGVFTCYDRWISTGSLFLFRFAQGLSSSNFWHYSASSHAKNIGTTSVLLKQIRALREASDWQGVIYRSGKT